MLKKNKKKISIKIFLSFLKEDYNKHRNYVCSYLHFEF